MTEYLKISRPGLWFPTIWIYVLPLGGQLDKLNSPIFWFGLFFVCFPLNFFVYSLNDLGDISSDAVNKRKGNFLFGAKADKLILQKAAKASTIILSLFMIVFSLIAGWEMLALLALILLFNLVYNFEPFRIKSRPPFELAIQIAYILTAVFSSYLNDVALIPWQACIYLCFFCFQAHLAGEIMDIVPDTLSNKTTTATIIGRIKSKALMIALLAVEVYILSFWFQDFVLAIILACFLIWLIIDMLLVFKNKEYSLKQMILFGYGMNAMGIASMIWVLISGKLLHPIWP